MPSYDDTHLASVRLTKKYAEQIDGIDLSCSKVGDLLDLPVREARMLVLEGWADPCERTCSDAGGTPEPTASDPTQPRR